MKQIYIRYRNGKGRMMICLDTFFPTTQARLNKLLKVIMMDYEHRSDHLDTMYQVCNSMRIDTKESLMNLRKRYAEVYQEVCDLERRVESHKHPNGVPLTDGEYIHTEKLLKTNRKYLRDLETAAKKRQRELKMLEINIERIEKERKSNYET